MTFVQRRIDLGFGLGMGAFGANGTDGVQVSGLRCSASVKHAGGVTLSSLELRIYGLTASIANRLSTLGKPLIAGRNNTVTVSAGDDETGMSVVFIGVITEAWIDQANAPDGVFTVQAQTGVLATLKPIVPSSYQGQADAATIMASLATQMGLSLENSGVSVQLANPYFSGTAVSQVQACARAANINYMIEGQTLAIWPKTGSRGGASVLISPDTGLVGYPAHTQNGIVVTTLFNPNIAFGQQVQVESSLLPAAGTWTVFGVDHDIEAETPEGKWFTRAQCTVLGHDQLPFAT